MDIQNVLMKVNIFDERHEMLEKYNTIWDIANNSIKKVFASELVYNEKYLKTKVKSYKGDISTNFHDNGISKEGFHCLCLLVVLILFLNLIKLISKCF